MSADVPTVILTGPAMVPLVRAAAALEAEDIPPFAMIGGVAVTVRLGWTLRATADLAAANPSLVRVVTTTVRDQLVAGVARARSVLLISNDERYQAITAEEINYSAGSTRRVPRSMGWIQQPSWRGIRSLSRSTKRSTPASVRSARSTCARRRARSRSDASEGSPTCGYRASTCNTPMQRSCCPSRSAERFALAGSKRSYTPPSAIGCTT